MARQVQPNNQTKPTVLPNQLVTVAKPVSASQLILTGNKQVLTPIMGMYLRQSASYLYE